MGMKKIILLMSVISLLLTGCSVEKTDGKKLKDIEFTVVDQDKLPEELKARIEEQKSSPFKLSYGDEGFLYIAEGYGEQKSSGYSVEVEAVYETENAVYIQTNLIGPSKDEEITMKPTYPYVAVKIEYNEKHIVFE